MAKKIGKPKIVIWAIVTAICALLLATRASAATWICIRSPVPPRRGTKNAAGNNAGQCVSAPVGFSADGCALPYVVVDSGSPAPP